MSRVVIWSPNYAPELTGIPPLVTDAADWLAARGHTVRVVSAVPNYPERHIHAGYRGAFRVRERRGGVVLDRSWLRVRPGESFADKVLYEASFAAFSLPFVVSRLGQTDTLVCVVPSLAAAAASAVVVRAARRIRLVLWVQDLVLLAAATVGGGQRAQRLIGVASGAEAAAARAADRVIVCSPGFRSYLVERGVPEGRVAVVHNWVDVDWIAGANGRPDAKPLRFLYAGNLGYTQGFETLVDAVRSLRAPVEVELVGDGNAAEAVRSLATGLGNVHVRPPVPRAELPELLASADVQLVLQRRAAAGANFPSKIASYLASGRPIIASLSGDVPAAETLRASGAAVLVEPESPGDLARAMALLEADDALRKRLGQRARAFSREHFHRDAALARLEAEILG